MEEIKLENEVVEYFDPRSPEGKEGAEEKVFYHVQGRPLPRCIYNPEGSADVQQLEVELPSKKKKRKTLRVILIAAAAFILVAAGAVGLGYVVGSRVDVFYGDDFTGDMGSVETDATTIPLVDEFGGAVLEITPHSGVALTAQEIYAKVNPAVVSVITAVNDGRSKYGTGMIFTPDGFVLTNAHVVEGGKLCSVYLSNGDAYEAKLVGYDSAQDLAVLKVEAQDLPCVEFGDSDILVVGDPVYAIGNPLSFELRGTMTDGIVSAINRDVAISGGGTMTLIQTNAALNSGNSGGPLINQYGQVVGVNVIKMMSNYVSGTVEGLGFAIPISATAHMINELIETGKMTPDAIIGISLDIAAREAEDGVFGLLIFEVQEDSGAEKAGLKVGDYILSIDGEEMETSDEVLRHRRGMRAGDKMEMTVWREGEILDITVILQEAK